MIKAIKYIHTTDVPLIFTAGLDRMAYIWDFKDPDPTDLAKGWCRGKLIQGYMMKRVEWDFPLSVHESKRHERDAKIEEEFA